MAITTSLGAGTPPPVQIIIPGADLTAGAPWFLDGSAGGSLWRVRGGYGTGAGAQVVLIDVAAPLNTVTTYTLTVAGVVSDTDTITRTYTGHDVLAAVDGSGVVDFLWLADGGDRREPEVRFHASDVAGRRRPPVRIDPVPGDGGGSILADTTGVNTTAMRTLIGTPCYMLHNAGNCAIPDCDIPLTELVLITRASNDRSSQIDAAHRRWALSYLLIDDPEPSYVVPLSTWDEFDAAFATWDAFDAYFAAKTWDEFDRTDWTTVGA